MGGRDRQGLLSARLLRHFRASLLPTAQGWLLAGPGRQADLARTVPGLQGGDPPHPRNRGAAGSLVLGGGAVSGSCPLLATAN